MSSMQRRKGANGERELARLIDEELGVRLVRNLEQSRAGGHDLIVDPAATGPVADALRGYAIEVKRQHQASPALLRLWWHQSRQQAARAGLLPCLCYRADRQGWRVLVPLCGVCASLPPWDHQLDYAAELSLPGFCALARECVASCERPASTHRQPLAGAA